MPQALRPDAAKDHALALQARVLAARSGSDEKVGSRGLQENVEGEAGNADTGSKWHQAHQMRDGFDGVNAVHEARRQIQQSDQATDDTRHQERHDLGKQAVLMDMHVGAGGGEYRQQAHHRAGADKSQGVLREGGARCERRFDIERCPTGHQEGENRQAPGRHTRHARQQPQALAEREAK